MRELVTINCSNLKPLITPDLELQLRVLKEHMDIDSFAVYN